MPGRVPAGHGRYAHAVGGAAGQKRGAEGAEGGARGRIWVTEGGRIRLSGDGYRIELNLADGRLIGIWCSGSGPIAVGLEDGGLWRLKYRDGYTVGACEVAKRGKVGHSWDPERRTLTVTWDWPDALISAELRAQKRRAVLRLVIENRRQAPVIAVGFPWPVGVPENALGVITWPESVGVGLTRRWLQMPAGEPSKWQRIPRGAELMTRLVGFGAKMMPLPGTPRPLSVTQRGRQVLPGALQRYLEGHPAVVVRPPEGKPDLVLLENADGPYLVGFRCGGRGLFMYFAGRTDLFVAERVVPALLRWWLARGDGKVALIAVRGKSGGGWMAVPVARWLEVLPRVLGPRLVVVRSPEALREVLEDSEVAAVFNPYAEHLLAADVEDARRMVDRIKEFVRRGGLWLDAGGYPLFYVLAPSRFARLEGKHPPLFCDMVHVDGPLGRMALYGVQRPGRVFVPASLSLQGQQVGSRACAVFRHEFAAWVESGKRWETPQVAVAFGRDLAEAARQYTQDNGIIGKPLAEKFSAGKAEKFFRSVLIRLHGPNCQAYMDYIEKLPRPAIIHMTEHLYIGFDKAYPDYLPPPKHFGTMEELRALYRKAHRLGFLMMPYVNPTWWCDQSPSLARYGKAVLAIGLDGKPYREAYGFDEPRNRGWSICALHPLVRKLDDRCLKQFVDDLGADILFQDQVGARGWKYDLNPAEPTPYAYTEGMIEIARHDSRYVPLSTERGWDRLIPYEVQFCGVGWAMVPKRGRALWSPQFWETFAPGEWQCEPVALYMAHDQVAFALHDLGHFIDDERALAMALALGHQMSLAISTGLPEKSGRFQWLRWLDVIQKQVAARYMGRRLDEFGHLSQLCVRGRYGDVEVVGSIEPQPVELGGGDAAGGVVLASPGYYVRAAGGAVEAGRVVRYEGRDYEQPVEFVRVRERGRDVWWVYGAGEVVLPAQGARAAESRYGDGRAKEKAEIVAEGGRQWVKARPPLVGRRPPAELADKAPVQWPRPPRYVGVVVMEPGGPQPGWADAGPKEWIDALGKSEALKAVGLKVKKLRAPDDLALALRDPRTYAVIVNPYGERFPVPGPDKVAEMLAGVREYVDRGGIWWETGGFSFFYPCWPKRENGRIVGWHVGRGMGGLALLLGQPEMLADNQPPEDVELTAEAKEMVDEQVAQELAEAQAVVNRPLPPSAGGWVLMRGQSGPYAAGYQVGGWGYLFRVGGIGQMKLTLPLLEASVARLMRTPPSRWPRGQGKMVWEVVVERVGG